MAATETLLRISTQGDISPIAQLTQPDVLGDAGYFLGALNNAPSTLPLELLRGKWNIGRRAFPQARQAYEASLELATLELEPYAVVAHRNLAEICRSARR